MKNQILIWNNDPSTSRNVTSRLENGAGLTWPATWTFPLTAHAPRKRSIVWRVGLTAEDQLMCRRSIKAATSVSLSFFRISERKRALGIISSDLPGSSCRAMNTSAQLAWSETRFCSTEQILSVSSSASWPCLLSTSFWTHVVSKEYSHFSNRSSVLASVILSSIHPAELWVIKS